MRGFLLRAEYMVACCLLSAACGNSAQLQSSDAASGGYVEGSCTERLAATVVDNLSTTVAAPTDFDASVDPAPDSKVFFTVLLPERCPGDRLPVILHSDGYGGTRTKAIHATGDLNPDLAHFDAIDELVAALPHHGYVVISFDQRGHGDTVPANGGGYARVIDPRAETQDARAIIDWAYDHSDEYAIARQPASGVDTDIRIATLGFSYGGGFQMPLAALDARIDTLVPNGTWYDMSYSLAPNGAIKLSYLGLECLAGLLGRIQNTPALTAACNAVGPTAPLAMRQRTREDLATTLDAETTQPRRVTWSEVLELFTRNSMGYFETQQSTGASWGFGEPRARLRPVPALFLQGNRDVLFNLTEGYHNARYFGASGADVRLISTEGTHMNPLANQIEGSANCGGVIGVDAALAWFDHYLKHRALPTLAEIPAVCVSVADTEGAADAESIGVALSSMPLGSLQGSGAIPVSAATLNASVGASDINGVFVRLATVSAADHVLAGIPTVGRLRVSRRADSIQTAIAMFGIGLRRSGRLILVDDQITAFAEGDYSSNLDMLAETVLLPGIGERLQIGDELGLLFYPQHAQYAAVISASPIPGIPVLVGGVPLLSALAPATAALNLPNSYDITLEDIQLPVLAPGIYPDSDWTPGKL